MDPLRGALATYRPRDDAEAHDVARVLALLDTGDPWARDRPLHVTASALVTHPPTRRLLLRWHERMGAWMQVGGHGDPGESDPWAIALREAEEETGLADLGPVATAPARVPIQVVVVPVPAAKGEPAHEHADVRYALATGAPGAARAETPAATVRWFTVDEARDRLTEANLRTFVDRVAELLDGPSRRLDHRVRLDDT